MVSTLSSLSSVTANKLTILELREYVLCTKVLPLTFSFPSTLTGIKCKCIGLTELQVNYHLNAHQPRTLTIPQKMAKRKVRFQSRLI